MIHFIVPLVAFISHATPDLASIEIPEVRRLFRDDALLPGRDHVFARYTKRYGLSNLPHAPRTPLMAKAAEVMLKRDLALRTQLAETCDDLLLDWSEANQHAHNIATAQYLLDAGHEVVAEFKPEDDDGPSIHQTRVLPTGAPDLWLTRLAKLLREQPRPVDLVVSVDPLREAVPEPAFDRNNEHAPRLVLSSADVRFNHATSSVEHEIFHSFQAQGQMEGRRDVWPDHAIVSGNPGRFWGRAGAYIRLDGYYLLEEIGAYARDALQATFAVQGDAFHWFGRDLGLTPPELIADYASASLSLIDGAAAIYERARALSRAGRTASVERDPILNTFNFSVTADTHIVISAHTDRTDTAQFVRDELDRGLRWIHAYQKFLRPRE